MTKERATDLLSALMDVTADKNEYDGAMRIFKMIGFTEEELKEMGYGEVE